MVGGEGVGLEIFGGYHSRGGRAAPADSLRRSEEGSPLEVVFRAASRPGHRARVPSHGGLSARRVYIGPLQGGHIPDPRESVHQSASQAVWNRFLQPYSDRRRQLYVILCYHRTHRCGAARDG